MDMSFLSFDTAPSVNDFLTVRDGHLSYLSSQLVSYLVCIQHGLWEHPAAGWDVLHFASHTGLVEELAFTISTVKTFEPGLKQKLNSLNTIPALTSALSHLPL